MNVTRKIAALKELIKEARKDHQSVGFVPTMGYLHDGHSQLVTQSVRSNDVTVVSIFVNPLQFNSAEDLEKYPRSEQKDVALLEQLGVDIVFIPDVKEVYPDERTVSLSVKPMDERLEGFFRPGHFSGVGLVVIKLLNFVAPDRAYFGLKDLQQYFIIRSLVRELSIPVEIIGIPTVRSEEGLALSSRNARLTDRGLSVASKLYEGLNAAATHLRANQNPRETTEYTRQFFREIEGIDLEYLEIVDPGTFLEVETFSHTTPVAICVAAYVEGVRLIDNLYLRPDSQE